MRRPSLSLLVLALALAAWPAASRAGDDAPTPPVAPKVAEKPATERTEEQLRIQAAVDALRPVVAEIRGLPWKHPVEAAVMSREALRAYMLEEMEKEVTPEEWARDTRILHRLGLLKPDEDLKQLALHMYQSAVAGFYNPETKKLYVVEGLDVEGQKPTMVHELIHAIEDQHFDLEKMEEPYREDDPDRQFAIRCLWEGSAEYGRRLFQDAYPDVARHYYQAAAKNPGAKAQQEMMRAVPTHMLLATLLHYRTGPNFVGPVLDRFGYREGMQKLLGDQPTTQEQVLHPWKWLGPRRDLPRTITFPEHAENALGEGWAKLDEHSVGEIDLAVYLDYFLGDHEGRLDERDMDFGRFVDARASRAAQGWDGGRTLYLEQTVDGAPGAMVIVHALAFDSVADAEDAARHLGAARRAAHGDSWKGEGWVKDKTADVLTQSYDFTCDHGHGRIRQHGREVLLVEGAPADRFDALWSVIEGTQFTQDPKDAGDDPEDPFEGFAVVDRRRGLGLKLPGEGWRASEGGGSPVVFATAQKDEVLVRVLVIDHEVSAAGLPNMARMVLGRMFDPARAQPAPVMGRHGIVHPVLASPGTTVRLYVAADAARTYMFLVQGPTGAVTAADADLQRLMAGVPGPLGAPPTAAGPDLEGTGAAGAPAGLRSIPGY